MKILNLFGLFRAKQTILTLERKFFYISVGHKFNGGKSGVFLCLVFKGLSTSAFFLISSL